MPWSVVQTHHNAAGVAVEHLVRQGFEVYDPRYLAKRKLADGRPGVRAVQLFPNYIFVHIVDRWRAVMSTIGVAKLLMSGDEKPAQVPPEVIDAIRGRQDKAGYVVLGKSKFEPGDRVQIKEGAFAFMTGICESQRDGDRVAILLSMLGTQRRVLIREENLVSV